jgi:bifunctional UDP-N-acetylglucosamine pyrophosphorylase / glucosamine-1-phosphate N-acetyltransferase
MEKLDVVILAAGKGERMVSRKPKVMHEILGKPLIGYVIDAAKSLSPSQIVAVTGYGRESVDDYVHAGKVATEFQAEQHGTAHALASAAGSLKGNDILVLLGDVPLVQKELLTEFCNFCRNAATVVFLTTDVEDPTGYGRVIMDGGYIDDIREHSEASDEERSIRRINTGICYIPYQDFGLIDLIEANNKKGERYLTDICKVAKNKGRRAKGFFYPRADEVLGINNLKGLLEASLIMRRRINEKHMAAGVTFLGDDIYIGNDVTIGKGGVIAPSCHIMGNTRIGLDVSVGPCSIITDSIIHDNVDIRGFVSLDNVEVKEGVTLGPFLRSRKCSIEDSTDKY